MQTGGGGYDTSTIIDLIERDYSGNFVIPNGTTKIGSYGLAFLPITGVSIPNTVTSIDSNGFYFCSNLKKLILPNSIINIGGNAFSSMTNYDIVIPESVTNINNTAFSNGNGGKITFLGLTPPTV